MLIANRQAVDLVGDRARGGSAPARSAWAASGAPLTDGGRAASCDDPAAPKRRPSSRSAAAGSRFQLASLGPDVRGVVIALNDVTDVSRAERVLAWGEMARQVAHEIKNPLTPMRLGLQHLRRVYRDRRADFDRTLEDTAERMLARDRPARHDRPRVQPFRRPGRR